MKLLCYSLTICEARMTRSRFLLGTYFAHAACSKLSWELEGAFPKSSHAMRLAAHTALAFGDRIAPLLH